MVDSISNGQTPPLWRLILAKDFRDKETGERFVYQHNKVDGVVQTIFFFEVINCNLKRRLIKLQLA